MKSVFLYFIILYVVLIVVFASSCGRDKEKAEAGKKKTGMIIPGDAAVNRSKI